MVRLVFIHLGMSLPPHLILNIKRHIQLFPEIPLTLVVDNQTLFLDAELQSLEVSTYVRKKADFNLLENLDHDAGFRHGFWIYSLERLFAFRNLHESFPNEKLLHIESDVLLLPNFPWKSFYKLNKMYWTRYNAEKDVASLLYSPSFSHTQEFIELFAKKLALDSRLTDMTGLSRLMEENDRTFGLLPSANHAISPLINSSNRSNALLLPKISENYDNFEGIFDPAAIGMWLTGQDPRNYFGFTRIKFRNIIDSGDSFIDPSNVKYVINELGELYLIVGESKIPVWNLHVHSKNLRLFSLEWKESLKRYVKKSGGQKGYVEFSFEVLIDLLRVNRHQRTLIRFFLNLPYIQYFKNKLLGLFRT